MIIADASSGFGRALFDYCAANGHEVAGCVRDESEARALRSDHPGARVDVVDVGNDSDVAHWAGELEEDGGMVVDVVVRCCAGGGGARRRESEHIGVRGRDDAGDHRALWETSREDFDGVLDADVKGVANLARHFVPWMIRIHAEDNGGGGGTRGPGDSGSSAGGAFVALTSGLLGRSADPLRAARCASAFAIEGVMKSVAMSLPAPLCAVALAPGAVATEDEAGGGTACSLGHGNKSSQVEAGEDIDQWVRVAGPMILQLNRNDNGRSLSVTDYHMLQERQT